MKYGLVKQKYPINGAAFFDDTIFEDSVAGLEEFNSIN